METMQSWFGLKDRHRDFTIDYDTDANLFFARHDLDEQLKSILKRSVRTGYPPKFVLYGDWGVGKTHTMLHMKYEIESTDELPAIVVFVELPDITSKSTFQVAHAALLDAFSIDRDWSFDGQVQRAARGEIEGTYSRGNAIWRHRQGVYGPNNLQRLDPNRMGLASWRTSERGRFATRWPLRPTRPIFAVGKGSSNVWSAL